MDNTNCDSNNMQEMVNLLIKLVREFQAKSKYHSADDLCLRLSKACLCLESHDLIGISIISESMRGEFIINGEDSSLQTDRNIILKLSSEIEQCFNDNVTPLTHAEELFLNISYNKFYDICSEIYTSEFWAQSKIYRLNKISQAFSIYSEIITYEPFNGVFKWLSKYRPPMESEISSSLFKFIRNVLAHFPFFDSWDEIWISKELVNWRYENQSIDKFLKTFCGKPFVKYRFKENKNKDFTYITINFPKEYGNEKIFLKNIVKENEGVKFALVMMQRVLNTQIESMEIKP